MPNFFENEIEIIDPRTSSDIYVVAGVNDKSEIDIINPNNNNVPKVKGDATDDTNKGDDNDEGNDDKTKDPLEIKTAPDKENKIPEDKASAVYKALLKDMISEGVLTTDQLDKLDELPGTIDSIKQVLEETVNKKYQKKQDDWKQSLSSEKKRFLDIEDAFDDEAVAIGLASRLEYLETINTEELSKNVELQKNVYFTYLLEKGFSKEDAMEKVNDAEALKKLDVEAKKSLPLLIDADTKKIESARQQKAVKLEENKKKVDEKFNSLITTIDTKESIIDGINLNKVAKDKIKENITKFVHTDDEGNKYTSVMNKQRLNPEGFDILINYLDTLGVFNIDKNGNFKPDISKIKAIEKTKAISELDKIISSDGADGFGKSISGPDDQPKTDLVKFFGSVFPGK